VEIAFKMLWGAALIAYGVRGLYRRQIGWSIGPILTTRLTGIPGSIFSLACMLGGALLAIPLLVAILANHTTETLFIHVTTYIGLPVAVIGLMLAVVIQLALDLGGFIRKLRGPSDG
jgi:hypothetical protein